jgi:hypothetical protein
MIKLSVLLEQQELQRVLFVGDSGTANKSSYAQLISKSKKVASSISADGNNTSDILDNFKRVNKSKFDTISVMSQFHKNENSTEAIENLKRLFIAIKEMNKKLIVVISPESADKESIVVNDWLESQTISDETIKSDNPTRDENASRDLAKLWLSKVLATTASEPEEAPSTDQPKLAKLAVKKTDAEKSDELQKDLDQAEPADKTTTGISLSKMLKPAIAATIGAGAATAGASAINYSSNVLSNAKRTMDFFIGKGLTPEQAAGIAGNLSKESNFNPTAVGDNGTSYGIAQWHNERWDTLKSWAKQNGKNPADFDAQLEFLWWELENTAKSSLSHLKQQNTPSSAAHSFAAKFERPSVISPTRLKNAENFFLSYSQPNS